MTSDFAARLRTLRERRGWTVVEMAERTGIPKRTLDKYMLRNGANLPGFEALLALAKGLGVSLDWLAFGADFIGNGSELLASVAAERASLSYFEMFHRFATSGERPIVDGEDLLGLTPEEWAQALGYDAGEKAQELAKQGVTREELLIWKAASKDRGAELLNDRAARMISAKAKS